MQRKEFTDPFGGKPGVFFFTSSHLETNYLFKEDDDFKYGVNTLAICLPGSEVSLLCYCLMVNHLHLLLYGTYDDCVSYYDKVMVRLAVWLRRKRGLRGLLTTGDVDIQAITEPKQFRNVVLYILRNPYRARVCSPFTYRWSSIDTYFNPFRDAVSGIQVCDMTVTQVYKLLGTRKECPAHYEVLDGVVLNRCFVEYSKVEKQLGDSLVFFDAMRLYDLESAVRLSFGLEEKVRFSDAELMERLRLVCKEEFHVSDITRLDRKSILLLARMAARRYGAGKKQIGRVTGLSQEILNTLL